MKTVVDEKYHGENLLNVKAKEMSFTYNPFGRPSDVSLEDAMRLCEVADAEMVIKNRQLVMLISSIIDGLLDYTGGFDDGRIMERQVPFGAFYSVMRPIVERAIGQELPDSRELFLAAYTLFAMNWTSEDEHEDIIERKVYGSIVDFDSSDDDYDYSMIYIRVPRDFAVLMNIINFEGFIVYPRVDVQTLEKVTPSFSIQEYISSGHIDQDHVMRRLPNGKYTWVTRIPEDPTKQIEVFAGKTFFNVRYVLQSFGNRHDAVYYLTQMYGLFFDDGYKAIEEYVNSLK